MFEKLAKFPIARSRRAAPGMIVPANDNHLRARGSELRRRPKLACRWFIDDAGRLGSRWETEAPEDPEPSRRDRSIAPFHRTVFDLSYRTGHVGPAQDSIQPGRLRAMRMRGLSGTANSAVVLHRRHATMRSKGHIRLPPSNCK